jgi:hypothetical protein
VLLVRHLNSIFESTPLVALRLNNMAYVSRFLRQQAPDTNLSSSCKTSAMPRHEHDFQFMKKTLTNGKGPRLLLCQKPISFLFMENICVRAINRAT